jgi:hypothetical protein
MCRKRVKAFLKVFDTKGSANIYLIHEGEFEGI